MGDIDVLVSVGDIVPDEVALGVVVMAGGNVFVNVGVNVSVPA